MLKLKKKKVQMCCCNISDMDGFLCDPRKHRPVHFQFTNGCYILPRGSESDFSFFFPPRDTPKSNLPRNISYKNCFKEVRETELNYS